MTNTGLPKLASRRTCTGCSACFSTCKVNAILMQPDTHGFLYPVVDAKKCVGCKKCESVCPVAKPLMPRDTIECYAAWTNDDSIRISSSSGGVFTELAAEMINRGGCVFGCVFDPVSIRAKHVRIDSIEDIAKIRGSKYVQSDLGTIFKDVIGQLQRDRWVLFSGTPCQIAGLQMFLCDKYDKLILCSVLCKGVPSPRVFEYHKREISNRFNSRLISVKTRDKLGGWEFGGGDYKFKNPNCDFKSSKLSDDYIRSFLDGYCNRISCRQCPMRAGRNQADIMIGDFWGIKENHPDLYSNLGVSCLLVYSEKGKAVVDRLGISKVKVPYEDIADHNHVGEEVMDYRWRWLFLRLYRFIGVHRSRCVVLNLERGRRFAGRVYRYVRRNVRCALG